MRAHFAFFPGSAENWNLTRSQRISLGSASLNWACAFSVSIYLPHMSKTVLIFGAAALTAVLSFPLAAEVNGASGRLSGARR